MLRRIAVGAAAIGAAAGGVVWSCGHAPQEAHVEERGRPLPWPQDMHLRTPVRIVNAIGDAVYNTGGWRLQRPLDAVEEEMEQLKSLLDTDEWEALQRRCEAYDEALHPRNGWPCTAQIAVSAMLRQSLRARILVEKEFEKHTEELDNGLTVPVVLVTGMPRTGSTFLHNLLAVDPRARHLSAWEQLDPVLDKLVLNNGKYLAMYHSNNDGELEEEVYLLNHCLSLPLFLLGRQTSLVRQIIDEPKFKEYRYLKRFVTLSNFFHPAQSHWVLKSPLHGYHMAETLQTFDEATVVVCHRNPLNVVPSFARLLSFYYFMWLRHDNDCLISREEFGPAVTEFVQAMNDGVEEAQRNILPKQGRKAVNVEYSDLMNDPIGIVKQIYDSAGLEFTEEYERCLEDYLEKNRKERASGKGSAHYGYALDDFGLSENAIRSRFAEYMEKHGY